MNHEKFTASLTDKERQSLQRIAAALNIDESACVSEAIRRLIVYYEPMFKKQKQHILKVASST